MILGYGLGALGQGAAYYFMSSYFVVFLTNCVGLGAAAAGTISSIALLVEVIAGMTVGNLSDKCTSKMGRRRPFMLTSSIVMLPILVIMLHSVDGSLTFKAAYYLFFAILFRIFFSTYEIPYNALGAEIATDYDERTRLRSLARVFSIAGNAIGYIMPLAVLELFKGRESAGWGMMGVILGVCCLVSWLISVTSTGKNIVRISDVKEKKNLLRDIIVNYRELLKLKAMKLLVVYKAAFTCAFSLFSVGTIYFLQYNLGLDNKYSSYVYVFTIVIFIVSTPIIEKMALLKGKAWQQMVVMGSCGIAGVLSYLFASDSVVGCAVYIGIFAVVQTGFWQVSNSIFYDIVEVDEYVNMKRREGDIMSVVSVLGTLITAIMVWAFGVLFDAAGFDAKLTAQPESVVSFLNTAYILIPCLCLFAGAAALKLFPINKKTFESLTSAISLRERGEPFDQYAEDLDKIVGRGRI